jgi:acetoacetyl-CoA synthetase
MTTSTTRPAPAVTQVAAFREYCEELAGCSLPTPEALHEFSLERTDDFWRALLTWSELPWSGSADVARVGDDVETARFFPDVRLNYAEALLRPLPGVDDESTAITAVHADRPAEHYSRARLRSEVARTAAVLEGLGLGPGERMVLVGPHTAGTIVAALAGAAIGAAVSTAAPDMGVPALLGRFEQVEPDLLLLDRAGTADATAIAAGLPTLRRVLVLDDGPLPELPLPVDRLPDLLAAQAGEQPVWERRPFDTPLFVMFSSGTTGPPKAMVHGAGGTLLEHLKELRLHVDLSPADTLYFHTTTAWMMWNWQLSALAVGARIVVNDAPVTGPDSLWRLVAEQGVTVFGTSPAYLQLCQDEGYRPAAAHDLSDVRAVLSTGAVLHDWQFDWVAEAVGPLPLQSISGGTDIIGCFVLGSPDLPVRRGRCQTRSLGLDVAAVDADGAEVVGRVGELVCRNPFPSRPVGFLRDPDGARFHASYFADHPGMWTHGDLIEFDPDGSARLHGRSDGVLNIDGVRIGPSEIYTVLQALPEISDAMAVEQRDPDRPGTSRMVLLVVLAPGTALDRELERTIRRRLREQASAAHVPSLVLAVSELPTTHNGKKSERAARDAVNGDPVVNAAALKNPGCLDGIRAAVAPAAPDLPAAVDGPLDASLLRDVTRIWCEVLGIGHADPDDDFGDLGGTSRQVLSLLRRIRLVLGVDISLQAFGEHPTPAGLARVVAATAAAGTLHAPVLRPGRGRPVFFVPDAWGQLNLYGSLVERLATERPLLGLRLTLADDDGRHRSIEEVAAEALLRVREVQPEGPYSLLGYSFGGLVAFELARTLRDAGQEVSYLGLVDTLPPAASMTRAELRARGWAARLESVLPRSLAASLAARLRPGRRSHAGAEDPEQAFFSGSHRVSHAYRPGRYDGAVTYYLAEQRRILVGNSLSAWRRVARHLLVTEVPGQHMDTDDSGTGILGRRNVVELAARVSATLG